MSRSIRKPYAGNPNGSKYWKKDANRIIRNNEEIGNNSIYKKINNIWTSPMENKHLWLNESKFRRK